MNRPTALKLAIVHDGRSQREIAAQAGLHEVTLSRIVRGLRCDEQTREKIAAALNRPVADLFGDDTREAA